MRGWVRDRATWTEGHAMKRNFSALLLLFCCILSIASTVLAKKIPPGKPLDLNRATAMELAQVPGIGPSTAKAIVKFWQKSGPFERVEDLLAIRGISSRKLEQMRPYVNVSRPAPHKPSSARESKIISG
jgi:competence ComEA-like helix-hairpin-helix protein